MEQLRMGIIGLGGRSSIMHYGHKPSGDSVVVAGADVSQDRLEKFKNEINDEVFITTDYLQLLAREDIDAVAIFTPDYMKNM